MKDLGRLINEFRLSLSWSMEELSSAANVDIKTLRKIIQGKSTPTLSVLLKLSDAFCVNLFLLTDQINLNHTMVMYWDKALYKLYRQKKYKEVEQLIHTLEEMDITSYSTEQAFSFQLYLEFYKALCFIPKKDFIRAEKHLKKTLDKSQKLQLSGCDSKRTPLESRIYSNLASLYLEQGKLTLSKETYEKGKNIYGIIDKHECYRLLNLCMNYDRLGENQKALEIAYEGLKASFACRHAETIERFVYRKGVAELKLGNENYKHTLHAIIELEKLNLTCPIHEKIIERLEKHYKVRRVGDQFIYD